MSTCLKVKQFVEGNYQSEDKTAIELKKDLIEIASYIRDKYKNDAAFKKDFKANVKAAHKRSKKSGITVKDEFFADIATLEALLSVDNKKFFDAAVETFEGTEVDGKTAYPLAEQERAIMFFSTFLSGEDLLFDDFIKPSKENNKNIMSLDSPPGTGKTKMIVKNSLRVAAKLGKRRKVLALASSNQKANDLHEELKDDEIGTVRNGGMTVKQLLANESLIADADTLVIDEAALVPSSDFLKLLSIANNKGIKILLLGDKKQLDSSFFSDGLYNAFNYSSREVPALTQRFRTSSALNIKVLKKLESNTSVMQESTGLLRNIALKVRFTRAKNKNKDKSIEENKLIGVNVNNNGVIDTALDRVSAMVNALNSNVDENETLEENINKNAAQGPISLLVISGKTEKNIELEKAYKAKLKHPNIKIKVVSLEDAQGDEADYVILETFDVTKLGLPNGESKQKLEDIKRAKLLNMLISRARFYAHIVNNDGYAIEGLRVSNDVYSYIESESLVIKAGKAKATYDEINNAVKENRAPSKVEYNFTDEVKLIQSYEELSTYLNANSKVDLNNPSQEVKDLIIEKLVEFNKLTLPNDGNSKAELETEYDYVATILKDNSNFVGILYDYKSKLEILLGNRTDNNDMQKEMQRLYEISDYDAYPSDQELEDAYSKAIEDGDQELTIELEEKLNARATRDYYNNAGKIHKKSINLFYKTEGLKKDFKNMNEADKRTKIIEFLQSNGITYLYQDTEASATNKDDVGITNEQLIEEFSSTGIDFKMGTKEVSKILESNPEMLKLRLDKQGDDIRIVLYSQNNKDKEGVILSQLILDKATRGDIYLFQMLNEFIGKEPSVIVDIKSGNIAKTAGPIIPSSDYHSVKELLTNLDNKEGLQHSGVMTIRKNDHIAKIGRSGVFYAYGNDSIDFSGVDFKSWANSHIFEGLDNANFNGYYIDSKGISHGIGFIPVDYKTHSLKDLLETVVKSQGEVNQDGESLVKDFKKKTGAIDQSLFNSKELIKFIYSFEGLSGSRFVNSDNISEAFDKQKSDNDKAILKLFNSLSFSEKNIIENIIVAIQQGRTGNLKTDSDGNLVKEEVILGSKTVSLPKIQFGKVITHIPSQEIQGESIKEFMHFDTFEFLKTIHIESNGDTQPEVEQKIVEFFDAALSLDYDSDSEFEGRIFNGISNGLKVDNNITPVEKKNNHIPMSVTKYPNGVDMDDVFVVNVIDVDTPRIIIDMTSALSEAIIPSTDNFVTKQERNGKIYPRIAVNKEKVQKNNDSVNRQNEGADDVIIPENPVTKEKKVTDGNTPHVIDNGGDTNRILAIQTRLEGVESYMDQMEELDYIGEDHGVHGDELRIMLIKTMNGIVASNNEELNGDLKALAEELIEDDQISNIIKDCK